MTAWSQSSFEQCVIISQGSFVFVVPGRGESLSDASLPGFFLKRQ